MLKFHQNMHKKSTSAKEIRIGGRELVKGNSASIKIDQETRSKRTAHFLRSDLPIIYIYRKRYYIRSVNLQVTLLPHWYLACD